MDSINLTHKNGVEAARAHVAPPLRPVSTPARSRSHTAARAASKAKSCRSFPRPSRAFRSRRRAAFWRGAGQLPGSNTPLNRVASVVDGGGGGFVRSECGASSWPWETSDGNQIPFKATRQRQNPEQQKTEANGFKWARSAVAQAEEEIGSIPPRKSPPKQTVRGSSRSGPREGAHLSRSGRWLPRWTKGQTSLVDQRIQAARTPTHAAKKGTKAPGNPNTWASR